MHLIYMIIPKQIRLLSNKPSTLNIKWIIQKPDADAEMSDTLQNDG